MLFMMGLLGLMAVGTTVMLGDDDEDMPMPEGDGVDRTEPSSEEMTDLGSLIPDDDGPVQTDDPARSDDNATEVITASEADSDLHETPIDDLTVEGSSQDGPTEEVTEKTSEDYATQTGVESDDTIEGENGNEFLLGYEGDDEINGNGGTDQIEGGDGDDTLSGGDGSDDLHGQDGDDVLSGDEGDDTLSGGLGDDLMDGGDGDDSLLGGQGQDTLEGGEGDDALHGYHGDDVMRGGEGEDALFGSLGDDILHGLSETGEDDGQTDFLNGGEGNDTITAGANDIVTAGDGADVIQFGDWNAEGGPAQVLDFQSNEDTLVVLYEEGAGEPEITFEQDSQNSQLYSVMADGEVIAEVLSATPVTSADVTLVEQSAA